ncbi:MAG: hypothetical protein K2X35_03110 [Bryobacteraceae bacterium]|nr:hypothetical protein [Bryobacteraceae bacterium]
MKLFLAVALVSLGLGAAEFDIEGIRLGMPIKEAMTLLRAHNPNMRLAPDSIPYAGLPSALTYGINAVGQGEGFYFLVTMPPNEALISKVTWVAHFAEDGKVPRQEAVVANLARKYGPISWDTGPAALSIGTRDIFWIDNEQGARVNVRPPPRCLGQSTFYMNSPKPGTKRWDPVSVRLPPMAARLRIEEGFVNRTDPVAEQCAGYTMVHARLFPSRVLGVRVPNLVEYVVLLMASGPLDRKTTQATHQYWLKTAKSPAPSVQKGK